MIEKFKYIAQHKKFKCPMIQSQENSPLLHHKSY